MNTNSRSHTDSQLKILSLAVRSRDWLRLMWRIPKSKTDSLLLILASVMINILALALPVALMQIYDRIIPNSSYTTMTWLISGVIAAIILETILKIARSYISNWLSARLDHILNTEALDCFLASRLDLYEQDKAGVQFERFNAVNSLKSYMAGQTLLILLDIPFAFLFLALLYYIGGFLVVYTMFIMGAFLILTLVCKTGYKSLNDKQVDLNKENLDFILETLGGIHTVKSMSMEEKLIRKFENIQARISDEGFRANRWRSLPANSAPFFSQLNMLGIIFLGADLVINGQITVGGMTACTMLATRALQPVTKLAGFWLRFAEVRTAQKQITQIIQLGASDHINNDIPIIRDIQGSVCFENFIPSQKNAHTNISKLNANIPAGQIVGVIGDNSELTQSLMLSICGMYKPSSGQVFIDEYRISSMDHSLFGGRVEYLAAKGRLFNGTILDNISTFDQTKQQIALDTATLMGLDKYVADLPNGYETQVDQKSNDSFPLGLIQRICFSRVLVTRPRILIIDRTLDHVDQETHNLVCEILGELKGKTTLFIVSDHGAFPLTPNTIIECTANDITITATRLEQGD